MTTKKLPRIMPWPSIADKTRRHKSKGRTDVQLTGNRPRSKRAPVLVRAWEIIHKRASHSPIPIEKKWAAINRKFYDTHFGVNGTMRYLNAYSCHSFL